MKTIKWITILLLPLAMNAQNNSEIQPEDINDLRFYERFIMEAGVRIPMDEMGDKIGTSPEIGIWVRSRLRKRNMLDIGGTISASSDVKDFDYSGHNTNYKVSPSGVTGMAGFRLAKVYPFNGGTYKKSLEIMPSLGYAFFMYRDRYKVDGKLLDNELKVLNTFHAGLGVRFTVDNLGVQAGCNYTPYGQFSSHVDQDFGAYSFSVGIVYKQ